MIDERGSEPGTTTDADALYGDGELPADADLAAPAASDGTETADSTAAEPPHLESTTTEE